MALFSRPPSPTEASKHFLLSSRTDLPDAGSCSVRDPQALCVLFSPDILPDVDVPISPFFCFVDSDDMTKWGHRIGRRGRENELHAARSAERARRDSDGEMEVLSSSDDGGKARGCDKRSRKRHKNRRDRLENAAAAAVLVSTSEAPLLSETPTGRPCQHFEAHADVGNTGECENGAARSSVIVRECLDGSAVAVGHESSAVQDLSSNPRHHSQAGFACGAVEAMNDGAQAGGGRNLGPEDFPANTSASNPPKGGDVGNECMLDNSGGGENSSADISAAHPDMDLAFNSDILCAFAEDNELLSPCGDEPRSGEPERGSPQLEGSGDEMRGGLGDDFSGMHSRRDDDVTGPIGPTVIPPFAEPVTTKKRSKFVIDNSFLLLGILMRSGSKRLKKDAYETTAEALSVAVANGPLLTELSWRKGEVLNPEDEQRPLSSIGLRRRVHILPSRSTVTKSLQPQVLKNMTLPMKTVRVRVNTKAVGGEAVARHDDERRRERRRDENPSCEVGIVPVAEIVKADVLNAEMWRAMNSDEARRDMEKSPLMKARDDLYGPKFSIDAIRPLAPNFVVSLREKEMVPDGSWRWTHCGVGDVVEIRGPVKSELKQCLRRSYAECEECARGYRGPYPPDEYFFGVREAIGQSHDSSCVGKISVVWNVGGASSWTRVNAFCNKVGSEREQVVQKMRAGTMTCASAAGGVDNVFDDFRYKAASNTSDDKLLLALLLSRAAQGRSYKARRAALPARRAHDVLPWSPMKAGDTVAMVSLPAGKEAVCPCMSCDEAKNSCVLVINRWWREGKENLRQFTYVPDISTAVAAILNASADASEQRGCPFGSSADPKEDVGPVVVHPATALRGEDSVGTTNARVTALWISRPSSEMGGEEFGGRDGHVTAAIRRRMLATAPTRGRTRTKDGKIVPYFIYRGYGYHDGFKKEILKQASACGLYWGCLSLPSSRRRSIGHVRVVSLCPPGTDVRDLYKVFFEDILDGAMNGIECVTADGEKILVFVDLVCILGDTPAVSEVLDVGGHKSKSPCHLCNYRLESEAGAGIHTGGAGAAAKARQRARFTDRMSHAALRTNGRTMFAHQAVRDAVNSRVLLESAGVWPAGQTFLKKSTTDEPDDDSSIEVDESDENVFTSSELPLHDFARAYERAALEGRVPRDMDGRPILPSYFCPYRGCPPVPEHLLTGIFADSVNAALAMFHNPEARAVVNSYFGMYHEACGIVVQSQYVNAMKPTLNTMDMTEEYALSVVAERALQAVANGGDRAPLKSAAEEKGLRDAIALVRSAAGLIAAFWKSPKENVGDGSEFADHFGDLVVSHLRLIEESCKSPAVDAASDAESAVDEDMYGSQAAAGRRGKRVGQRRQHGHPRSGSDKTPEQVTKNNRKTSDNIVRALADCPNTHRLMELAVFLPFLRHGHFVAELPFESKHQPMKRMLEQFQGQASPHLYVMEFALLDDWKGRLCSLYERVLQYVPEESADGKEEVEKYVRGLLPLLYGREMLPQDLTQRVPDSMVLRVQNIFGLSDFVPKYLSRNFVSIMSSMKRGQTRERPRELVWKVGHKEHRNTSNRSVLKNSIVAELSQATKSLFNGATPADWPGVVALCENDGDPAAKFSSGQYEFMRKIEIGSVVSCRVGESWCKVTSGHTVQVMIVPPSSVERSAGSVQPVDSQESHCQAFHGEPCAGSIGRYFCVEDIYTVSDGDVRVPGSTGAATSAVVVTTDDENRGNYKPPVIIAVVREVLDAVSGEPASADTISYQNALCVRSSSSSVEAEVAVSDIWPYYLLRLDGVDAGIRPVAVLTSCDTTDGCGWVVVYRYGKPMPKIHHGERCGPRLGGEFFIRDAKSGFPHRSS